jgi:hypothetical protein
MLTARRCGVYGCREGSDGNPGVTELAAQGETELFSLSFTFTKAM